MLTNCFLVTPFSQIRSQLYNMTGTIYIFNAATWLQASHAGRNQKICFSVAADCQTRALVPGSPGWILLTEMHGGERDHCLPHRLSVLALSGLNFECIQPEGLMGPL